MRPLISPLLGEAFKSYKTFLWCKSAARHQKLRERERNPSKCVTGGCLRGGWWKNHLLREAFTAHTHAIAYSSHRRVVWGKKWSLKRNGELSMYPQPPSQFNRFYVETALTRDDDAKWPCLVRLSFHFFAPMTHQLNHHTFF